MGTNWVYIESEKGLWTVGFYDPSGEWHPESDHADREEAAKKVHYLNGGKIAAAPELLDALQKLVIQVQQDCSIGSDPKFYEMLEVHQQACQAIQKATS